MYQMFTPLLVLGSLALLPGFFPDARSAASPNVTQPQEGAGRVEERTPTPPSGLTRDLLYTVLVGQIATQREAHQAAFTHFLRAARLARDQDLAEEAARAAMRTGETEAIGQAVEIWLEVAPESMAAHQLAAYIRLQSEDVDGAMHHLRRLIHLASDEGENGFMQAARLVHKLRPPEKRLELMRYLTDGEPENADAWFARALVAAGVDRHADAAEAARRATELRPGWTEPRLFLVQMLRDLNQRAEARATLERFVAEIPGDRALRLLYAQFLVDEKEFVKAREVFAGTLAEKPKDPDVFFALGVLSLQLDDLPTARNYFTRLYQTGERRDEAAYYLGQIEEIEEHSDAAISWYEKVRGDQALDAQVRMARLEANRGALAKARDQLRGLRDRWPENAVLLYLIEAEILVDLDQDEPAMAVYDTALEHFPGHVELLYARALHGVAMQRIEVLERDLRAILAQDPEHADALNALGYTLADQTKRHEEARELIERAFALKPEEPAILDSMGWVQYRLGHLEQALEYLRRAFTQMPDGEIAAHLGEALWALGRHDEAWRVWETALTKEPEHAYLLRVIHRHRFGQRDSASP